MTSRKSKADGALISVLAAVSAAGGRRNLAVKPRGMVCWCRRMIFLLGQAVRA